MVAKAITALGKQQLLSQNYLAENQVQLTEPLM